MACGTEGIFGGSRADGGHPDGGPLDGGPPGGGAPNDGGTPGGLHGQSLVWVFTNFSSSLANIAAHSESFTQVSPTLYDVNFNYTSGVARFWGGSDSFDGLTSQQICQRVHAAGLQCVPAIFGGAANSGTDQGLQNILNDSPTGAQSAFITSMVAEAKAKGYDGYNVDWEVLTTSTDYANYGAKFESFLGAFKSALHQNGMTLSVDLGTWYMKQTYCSGGNGVIDLTQLGQNVDWAILEDYDSVLGTASTTCPASLPNPQSCTQHFVDDLNLMCRYLPANVVSIGLDSKASANNPIAGAAFSVMQSYGIANVAVWPDTNNNGPGGSYQFLDTNGIVPAGVNWYDLLKTFRQNAP